MPLQHMKRVSLGENFGCNSGGEVIASESVPPITAYDFLFGRSLLCSKANL